MCTRPPMQKTQLQKFHSAIRGTFLTRKSHRFPMWVSFDIRDARAHAAALAGVLQWREARAWRDGGRAAEGSARGEIQCTLEKLEGRLSSWSSTNNGHAGIRNCVVGGVLLNVHEHADCCAVRNKKAAVDRARHE